MPRDLPGTGSTSGEYGLSGATHFLIHDCFAADRGTSHAPTDATAFTCRSELARETPVQSIDALDAESHHHLRPKPLNQIAIPFGQFLVADHHLELLQRGEMRGAHGVEF